MTFTCATRSIKNAKLLQAHAPRVIPRDEPLDGFGSVVPSDLLARLHTRIRPEELAGHRELAAWLRQAKIPAPLAGAREPLFNGALVFAKIMFGTHAGSISISDADMATALAYSRLAVGPISRYASQYGPNRLDVSPNIVPFSAPLQGRRYNDQMLQSWVNALATQARVPGGVCIAVLNPPGVVNADADPAKGIGGYHSLANVPYIFANVSGRNLTIEDQSSQFALPLSHEIAEVAVDPNADSVNPEVCDPCLPPNELLLGDSKAISEYLPGDRVIGASGLENITETFVRPYEGNVVEVKALGMLPFRATPNHPVWAVEAKERSGRGPSYGPPVWKPLGEVVPKRRFHDGDYLVMPRIRGTLTETEIPLAPYLSRYRQSLKIHRTAVPQPFPLTVDTAWLLGLYVAEGYAGKRKVNFSLGDTERRLRNRIIRIARELGHRAWADRVSGERSINVHIASVAYSHFFPATCGSGAARKKIPDFVLFHRDERLLRAFLDGYIAGDGNRHHTTTGYEVTLFTTVSKALALQLQIAYGRLGTFVSLRLRRKAGRGMILGRVVRLHDLYSGLWCSDVRAVRNKRLHANGTAFYLPVKSVSSIAYKGVVHNLETIDHTYLASNIAVSNCGPNCQTVWRDYFDMGGRYIATTQAFPPPFAYRFYINGIVRPSSATACPAPASACNYAPP